MDEIIQKILGLLEDIQKEKGVPESRDLVDKNIIKSENSTFDDSKKENASLSSREKKKLTETFTLFNELFFKYKKQEESEAPKTFTSQAAKTANFKQNNQEKVTTSSWGKLLAGLMWGAAAIAIFFDQFKNLGGPVLGMIAKVGIFGALKFMAGTLLKVFAKPLLKRLPIIGSLINFYEAYQAFKAGKPVMGILEIVSGLLNFVPGLGTALSLGMDVLITILDSKGMFEGEGALSSKNAWGTIKGWASDIGTKIWDNALRIPILGTIKRFGMAWDLFKAGSYGEGIEQILLGILSINPVGILAIEGYQMLSSFLTGRLSEAPKEITENSSWSDKMVEWIRSKLKVLPWWMKKPLAWFGLIPDSMVGDTPSEFTDVTGSVKAGFDKTKEFIGGIWDDVKGPMAESVDTVKGFAVDTWEKTKKFSSDAWNAVSEQAPKVWDSIKDTASSVWESTKNLGSSMMDSLTSMTNKAQEKIKEWAPSIVSTISDVADNAMKVLKGIADKIGSWISDLFTPSDEKKLETIKEEKKTSMTNKAQEYFSPEQAQHNSNMLASSNTQTSWLRMLNDAAEKQVELLTRIANVESLALLELKRISGNSNGSGGSMILPMPSSRNEMPVVPIGNNRSGYATSPYALSH